MYGELDKLTPIRERLLTRLGEFNKISTHLEKESKKSTLCVSLNEKDKTMYNENI